MLKFLTIHDDGFYAIGAGKNLPSGAIEITDDQLAEYNKGGRVWDFTLSDFVLEPVDVTLAKAQDKAKKLRESEWHRIKIAINILEDKGLDAQLLRAYRVSLRDMTLDPLWLTDPIAVADAIIATRP